MLECLDVALKHYEDQLPGLRRASLDIFKEELKRRGLEHYIDDVSAARLLTGQDGATRKR